MSSLTWFEEVRKEVPQGTDVKPQVAHKVNCQDGAYKATVKGTSSATPTAVIAAVARMETIKVTGPTLLMGEVDSGTPSETFPGLAYAGALRKRYADYLPSPSASHSATSPRPEVSAALSANGQS